ncbi:retrovirus-related pol polyprotein from transposon TNT 1-94 [Tanacetum coccineum]
MEESLPTMGLILERQQNQADVAKMIADAIQQERENLRAEISSQITNAITNHIPSQVDPSVRNYMSSHILHLEQDDLPIWIALKYKFERLHVSDTPCRPSAVRPRDRDDLYDDAHPKGENSAKRQNTSENGTYVFKESSSGQDYESKPGPLTSDPKAPALSLVNQDLLYLKKGSSGAEKIVMSLHKFPAVIFHDDDIEEITSRWVDKCVKKFNPYARYNVEHWKNPHAKIFYIKKQKEFGKPKEIVARRANGSIVSITESDYKNLNKNDIEDMYLLIVNNKVNDYAKTGVESYQQKVNLTAPTITFPGIEKYKVFSIISELVYGIIYKKSKNEKRVMRHQKVHKFCDAIVNRVFEGLKSYNNDVKHGYVTPSLSNEDVEYLQLFDSLIIGTNNDMGVLEVPYKISNEVVVQQPKLRKSKRNRTPKSFGPEIHLYLIEGIRDEKEETNDEMDSIMGNNIWVLADLLPGFRQKLGIYYFDTYALVARISTIRLLIALLSIHNLIIHRMDVKTAFLNGELDEEVYMNQPRGFIMLSNETKVCKLSKSLYGLKQAPKQWHQKFNEVVLSSGYLLNQADKYVYRKFAESGKGVIICLYIDNMLIFRTDQDQMDLTKIFLSSRFSMKDMEEANVILGRRIKHEGVGKEAKWLKNLILEIPLWSKPIAPISIYFVIDATFAKAYIQMYNGVIYIEFVRSQQNLAGHLKKSLATDLVIK